MKRTVKFLIATILTVTLLCGCGGVYIESDVDNIKLMDEEDAIKEISAMLSKVDVVSVENPIMDIYADETEAAALADIETFPLMVQGHGDITIEVAGATELSADAPDDWLNVVAKNFNKSGATVDGKSVQVSVRKITSGEVVTYINANAYKPNVYIPSNYAWGLMLDSSGVGITKISDRIAGNTAGVLMTKEVNKAIVNGYGEVSPATLIQAANDGKITFAYTNPYTSSTGLNMLTAMLNAWDLNDPLSSEAANSLMEYQKTAPPVAYTTAVLRNQARKGLIDCMVMEEQAYINTTELKGWEYTPFGIRHDHPVYVFDWNTSEENQAAQLFVDFCLNEESQRLATEKGFNRHDEYKSNDPGLNGTGYLTAQSIWKQNKNGGRPVVAMFITDCSGSMRGEPLAALQEAIIGASSYIDSQHYVGLVSYNTEVTINLPIAQFDAKQRAYFAGEAKALTATGGTNTWNAVLVAMDEIYKFKQDVPDAVPLIILLTDGETTGGYSLGRLEQVIRSLKIPVYTIAYNDYKSSELEQVSGFNVATCTQADAADIVNHLRNLFNVNM